MQNTMLRNAHLEGGPFFWAGGPVGVLLVHGFTATAAEVRPLARILHNAGYTVGGPLLPGHGTIPDDLNQIHWEAWIDAAETTYRQLAARCDRVFVGGESMGALTALYLAAQHPEVAGILAYTPALKLALSPIDVLKIYMAAPFVGISVSKGSNNRHSVGDERWQGYPVNPLRGVIQLFQFQKAVRAQLPNVHQPLLVVQARFDTTINQTSGKTICAAVESTIIEFYMMENSTHIVILDEELEDVAALTLQFIAKIASR